MEEEKRKYSIEEIANICNVSKATVSRVINHSPTGVGEETRKRVQTVIEKLNYRPNNLARSVATSRSQMIGLIVTDVSNFFYPKIIRSVTDYMNGKGYAVIIGNSDYNPEKEADQLLSMIDKRVDGIILCSGVSNAVFLKDFKKYHVPLALIGRAFDSSLSEPSIMGDNEIGAGYTDEPHTLPCCPDRDAKPPHRLCGRQSKDIWFYPKAERIPAGFRRSEDRI